MQPKNPFLKCKRVYKDEVNTNCFIFFLYSSNWLQVKDSHFSVNQREPEKMSFSFTSRGNKNQEETKEFSFHGIIENRSISKV